jgi:hypothetical protein
MGGEELNAPVGPAETVTAGPEGAEKRGLPARARAARRKYRFQRLRASAYG